MQSLSSVWKSKDTSTTTKVRLLKALVWSVAIYGSGPFAVKKRSILKPWKCGATEGYYEFHGHITRRMDGFCAI